MSRHDEYLWDEALPELIPEVADILNGFTHERWGEVCEAINEHISLTHEFRAPVPSQQDLFEMNEKPRREADAARIRKLEEEVKVYEKDILRVHGGQYTTIEYGSVVIHDS